MVKQIFNMLSSIGSSAAIFLDMDGNIDYINDIACTLIGLSMPELKGRHIPVFNPPWEAAIQGKSSYRAGAMELLELTSNSLWVDWKVFPFYEDSGSLRGWFILFDDRTECYNDRIIASNAEKLAVTAAMTASLAHKLRNPIGAARGLMQLAGVSHDPDKMTVYSQQAIAELDRLTDFLNEFLYLGSPAHFAEEPLDLNAFLLKKKLFLLNEAERRGVKLLFDLSPAGYINADPCQLEKAVMNLAVNAFDAAGRDGRVIISLSSDENNVSISVSDNGPGFSDERKDVLFVPFFSTKHSGKGLGLPVVQAIVHKHNGEIFAECSPAGGTVFRIVLPAVSAKKDSKNDAGLIIALSNQIISYACEQTFKTAGFSLYTAESPSELKDIHFTESAVLLVDKYYYSYIPSAFPLERILLLDNGDHIKVKKSNHFPLPIDYIRLIEKIKRLHQTAAEE